MHSDSTDRHPSGLTWERWHWPFHTPEERKLIARYFKSQEKAQEAERFSQLPEAPF